MKAGELDTIIIIEQKTATLDAVGDEVIVWSEYKKAWAKILTQSGKEFINAKEVNSSVEMVVKIRFMTGIIPGMRVNNGGSYYNILSAFDPNNMRVDTMVYCNVQL